MRYVGDVSGATRRNVESQNEQHPRKDDGNADAEWDESPKHDG